MSEFIEDTGKQVLPKIDKHGFTIKDSISDAECILKCVQNCEFLCGMDRKQTQRLIKQLGGAKVEHFNTYNHARRQSKKIVIEYDIQEKNNEVQKYF